MLLSDLPVLSRETLDSASDGLFTSLLYAHPEVHLTVRTQAEGLQEGEVKLYIMVLNGQEMADYAIASLGGAAKIIGLQVYISDKLASARARVAQVAADISRRASLH
jgi:hypothetical protein